MCGAPFEVGTSLQAVEWRCGSLDTCRCRSSFLSQTAPPRRGSGLTQRPERLPAKPLTSLNGKIIEVFGNSSTKIVCYFSHLLLCVCVIQK